MDPLEERLRGILAAGFDIWSLIDTAITVAARDHSADFRRRRESIVQSLYSLTPCRNCDPNFVNGHVLGSSTRANNGDGSVVTIANGHGNSSGVNHAGSGSYHNIEASPEMRAVSPTPSPEAASPELEFKHTERGGEDEEEEEDRRENWIRDLISIKEFLEDPDQRADEESLVCLLQSLMDMDVTYEVLIQTDIARHVSALRKHQNDEVRPLAREIVSKWKSLVNARAKTNSVCDSSSSPPVQLAENGSPQKIPSRNHHNNSSGGPHDLMRSPKRQNGGGSSERSGSDFNHSRTGSSSKSEAPTRPNSNDRASIPSAAPPAKRKERADSPADQARLDSARKRLQENYQEAQNAKKQRTVQVMSLNEIPRPKNAFIRRGGSTARNR